MKKEDILNSLDSGILQRDVWQGIADALGDILNNRNNASNKQTMPQGPIPPGLPPVEIDPEKLNLPHQNNNDTSDIEFDDPDNLMDQMKQLSGDQQDSQDSQDDQDNSDNQSNNDSQQDTQNSDDSSQQSGQKSDSSSEDSSSNEAGDENAKETKGDDQTGGNNNQDSAEKSDKSNDSADSDSDSASQNEIQERIRLLNRTKSLVKKAINKSQQENNQELTDKLEAILDNLEEISNNTQALSDKDSTKVDTAINDATAALSELEDIKVSDDIFARDNRIKKLNNDKMKSKELEDEDRQIIDKDWNSVASNLKREIKKYNNKLANTRDLEIDLQQLARREIITVKTPVRSWRVFSARLESENIINKNPTSKMRNSQDLPLFQCYVDQSASWGVSDIQKAKKVLSILNKYVEKKQIEVEIWYFGDDISRIAREVSGHGTSAWPKIYENIKKTTPTNVIIMTDDDLFTQSHKFTGPLLELAGGVLWCWKGGLDSSDLKQFLRGRLQNTEYSI